MLVKVHVESETLNEPTQVATGLPIGTFGKDYVQSGQEDGQATSVAMLSIRQTDGVYLRMVFFGDQREAF